MKNITSFDIQKMHLKVIIQNCKMINSYKKLPRHKQNMVRCLLNQSVLIGNDWIKPITKVVAWFYGLHSELFSEQPTNRDVK